MTVARAIIGHTLCVQQRAAAAGSSIGPTASNVPKAWKLATRLRTTSAMKMARNAPPFPLIGDGGDAGATL